jgi:hypothetical protein
MITKVAEVPVLDYTAVQLASHVHHNGQHTHAGKPEASEFAESCCSLPTCLLQ